MQKLHILEEITALEPTEVTRLEERKQIFHACAMGALGAADPLARNVCRKTLKLFGVTHGFCIGDDAYAVARGALIYVGKMYDHFDNLPSVRDSF